MNVARANTRLPQLRHSAFIFATEIAGPIVIIAAVLAFLERYAFQGVIPAENQDVLSLWIPYHCFLGESLSSGTLPGWNPHIMGGFPFAADPQSGWLYLPVMSLYSLFSCDVAIRYFILAQPILSGIGTYLFLRSEGATRTAATGGGLTAAMLLATTKLGMSLPFAGALAWTPWVLAGVSRYLRARTWPGRIVWAVLAALAWSQLAVAHLSHGLVTGSGAVAVFFVYRFWRLRRDDEASVRHLTTLAVLLVAVFATISLAALLPRVAYTPRTSLSLGYQRLRAIQAELLGIRVRGFQTASGLTELDWPLRLMQTSVAPVLLFCFSGLFSKRHRGLSIVFLAFGVFCFVIGLRAVVEPLIPNAPPDSMIGDFFLHKTGRFRYGTLSSLAVLSGLGLDAWLRAESLRLRALMLVPGVLVWLGVTTWAGLDVWEPLVVLGAGAVIVVAGFVWRLFPIVAAALVLAALALVPLLDELPHEGGSRAPVASATFPPGAPPIDSFIKAAAYLRPGPFERILERSEEPTRLLSLDPPLTNGPPLARAMVYRRLQLNRRAQHFGAEEAQGYNPSQLTRYWVFVQAANSERVRYNTSVFHEAPKAVLDLLGIGWVVAPETEQVRRAKAVAVVAGWRLYRLDDPVTRASVVTDYRVLDEAEALNTVSSDNFDSTERAVLEEAPEFEASGRRLTADAEYESIGTQGARVRVSTPRTALVVIRNSFDRNWSATIDGEEAPILRTDYFLQGVVVPKGTHTIELRYDDPMVGLGLFGSSLALVILLGTAAGLALHSRRSRYIEKDPEPA
jgi:hypothetical protein